MRARVGSFLLLALAIIASLSVVSCGGGEAAVFSASNLVISPTSIQAGDEVQISVTVTNSGGASGNYNVDLNVGGIAIGNQTVAVAAGTSTTVHFAYTPEAPGTFTVVVDSTSGSLTVTPTTGYWEIPYKAIEGSYIVYYYSVSGATPMTKLSSFNESSGIRFTMHVNKSVVDGTREVIIPADAWVFPTFTIPNMIPGMDVDITLPLGEDAIGTLYVQDGICDVDISSESTSGHSPIQTNTYGDDTEDPAGSVLIPITFAGEFVSSGGQEGNLPLALTFSTGHTDNTVHTTSNKKMDGAFRESDGVPFAKDGGVADYTGTIGTITATGTGDCLGIKLMGIRLDFQTEFMLVLEPAE